MLRLINACRCRIFYIVLIMLLVSFVPSYPANVDAYSPPLMRVGITLTDGFLRVTFSGGYRLTDRGGNTVVDVPAGEYRFAVSGSAIQVQDLLGRDCGLYSGPLYLESTGSPADSFFEIKNARYGKVYRGELEISRTGGGERIDAVNIVDLETYLRGVIPREMPSSWGNYGGMEALKAQAVTARTYALYNQSLQRHSGCHICDTQHCQVYGGKDAETSNTDLAIAETRGEILTCNGTIIQPFYHATNGGFTEQSENVWLNPIPYFRAEADPYDDPHNPLGLSNMVIHRYATWESDVPLEKINSLLSAGGYANIGPVERIQIRSAFPSGRVRELAIEGTGGGTVSLFKEKARTVFGLNSQLFTVREEPEPRVWIASGINGVEAKYSFSELEGKWVMVSGGLKSMLLGDNFRVLGSGGYSTVPYRAFVFEGRGWGHGIGMSQNGAYNRSRAGHNYRDILSFYYPGAAIVSAF